MKIRELVLMGMLAFSACSSGDDDHVFQLDSGQRFALQEEYASVDHGLSISVEHVSDSRCPTGVVCVWEGEATVYLYVRTQNVQELVLSTVRQPKDTVQNYEIELVDVSPYPDISREIEQEDYEVTLKITRIDP